MWKHLAVRVLQNLQCMHLARNQTTMSATHLLLPWIDQVPTLAELNERFKVTQHWLVNTML